MSNDSPTSLLSRAWHGALALFGTVVLLWASVTIVERIWKWLVVIAVTAVLVLVLVVALRRWLERSRW